jgi:hypothetical protein
MSISAKNIKFNFNINKSISAIGFILSKLNGKTDFHKIFKIMYFADQKHLVDYARPITGDYFIAMENGPVPSTIYDSFKSIRHNNSLETNIFNEFFSVEDKYYVSLKGTTDNSYLSKSDIECLEASILENKDLNFKQLTKKSHDVAYSSCDQNNEIDFLTMAKAGGANEIVLNYIETISDNLSIKI